MVAAVRVSRKGCRLLRMSPPRHPQTNGGSMAGECRPTPPHGRPLTGVVRAGLRPHRALRPPLPSPGRSESPGAATPSPSVAPPCPSLPLVALLVAVVGSSRCPLVPGPSEPPAGGRCRASRGHAPSPARRTYEGTRVRARVPRPLRRHLGTRPPGGEGGRVAGSGGYVCLWVPCGTKPRPHFNPFPPPEPCACAHATRCATFPCVGGH